MSNMTKTMAVFAGSTCPELAEDIATALGTTLGNVKLEKFSNGEILRAFVAQTFSSYSPLPRLTLTKR